MKRNDRNMRRGTIVLLCKIGRLLLWEGGAIDSNLRVASQLGCNAELVEGEVDSNNNSKVH